MLAMLMRAVQAMFIFGCGVSLTTASCPTARLRNCKAASRTPATRKTCSISPCGRWTRSRGQVGQAHGELDDRAGTSNAVPCPRAHLGKSFDIHGGGRDLVFPHHENEIAQSVCANNSPYAMLWMHSGLVTVEERKMSKSLHNHITIAQFLQDWSSEVLRLAVFTHHYRSNVDFSPAFLRTIRRRLFYYCETLVFLRQAAGEENTKILAAENQTIYEKFTAALCDDLNTPEALAQLNIACKKANELRRNPAPAKDKATQLAQLIVQCGELLGILRCDPQVFITATRQEVLQESGLSEQQVHGMMAERVAARQSWQLPTRRRTTCQVTSKRH